MLLNMSKQMGHLESGDTSANIALEASLLCRSFILDAAMILKEGGGESLLHFVYFHFNQLKEKRQALIITRGGKNRFM